MKNSLKPFSVFLQLPLKFEQRKSSLSEGYFLDSKRGLSKSQICRKILSFS